MEKKSTIICLILVGVIVCSSAITIILMGIPAKDYNYIQLEINPRIEMICDKNFKVVSTYPLNQDARIVLSDLDLTGLSAEDATVLYLNECAKTGYIDVDGANNATNITIIDGLTQALDVHVTKSVYKYFRENEILSAIVENYEDRHMFDMKKEHKLCCANKYKLISTMAELDNTENIDTLKKYNEVSLIEKVANNHKNKPFIPTPEELETKQKLIQENQSKYNNHLGGITSHSQRSFSTLFDKYQKHKDTSRFFTNFSKEYTSWKKDRS
jgi:hypothetical protein